MRAGLGRDRRAARLWGERRWSSARRRGGRRVANGFRYDSGSNAHFLKVEEIRELVSEHVIGKTVD